LTQALQAVAAALDDLPGQSMIIGGIAVIARGVPRLTRDIDATVAGAGLDLERAVSELGRHGIVVRIDDALEFAAAHQVLLLRHESSSVDVDLSIAWLPFELEALGRAERLDLAGTTMRIAHAEDLVVYKFVAWRPQDQQDAERLLTLHGHAMNLNRVRELAAEFAEALDEPARVAELERLIARSKR
jgi:hypothetical protein